MLLALDAGNSTITAGCVAGGEVKARAVFATAARTSDEYAVLMSQALAMHGVEPGGFDGAIVACVVPQMTKTLARAARMLAGVEPLVVGAGVKTGLNIGIDDPSQLGADLVASAVGALADREPPLIICDLGTATSVCVIDARSRLLGGAILPGAAVSLDALAGSAALLPGITLEAPKQCIGTNTNDCMKSGAVFGTAAAIDGMIDRFEQELGCEARYVATGTLAGLIIPHCRREIEIDDALALKGLERIWIKNQRRK